MKQLKKAKKEVTKFLQAWKRKDYEAMYMNCQQTYCSAYDVADLKQRLSYELKSYRMVSNQVKSDVMIDFCIRAKIDKSDTFLCFRTVSELGPFKPSIEGEFGINPISFKKLYKKS